MFRRTTRFLNPIVVTKFSPLHLPRKLEKQNALDLIASRFDVNKSTFQEKRIQVTEVGIPQVSVGFDVVCHRTLDKYVLENGARVILEPESGDIKYPIEKDQTFSEKSILPSQTQIIFGALPVEFSILEKGILDKYSQYDQRSASQNSLDGIVVINPHQSAELAQFIWKMMNKNVQQQSNDVTKKILDDNNWEDLVRKEDLDYVKKYTAEHINTAIKIDDSIVVESKRSFTVPVASVALTCGTKVAYVDLILGETYVGNYNRNASETTKRAFQHSNNKAIVAIKPSDTSIKNYDTDNTLPASSFQNNIEKTKDLRAPIDIYIDTRRERRIQLMLIVGFGVVVTAIIYYRHLANKKAQAKEIERLKIENERMKSNGPLIFYPNPLLEAQQALKLQRKENERLRREADQQQVQQSRAHQPIHVVRVVDDAPRRKGFFEAIMEHEAQLERYHAETDRARAIARRNDAAAEKDRAVRDALRAQERKRDAENSDKETARRARRDQKARDFMNKSESGFANTSHQKNASKKKEPTW